MVCGLTKPKIVATLDPNPIHMDIRALPSIVTLNMALIVTNLDVVPLYLKVRAVATGWSFTTKTLGRVGVTETVQFYLENWGTRSKPSNEVTDVVTVTFDAYYDESYLIKRGETSTTFNVHFIDSSSPEWTVDALNNFDDGTPQGWTGSVTYGVYSIGVDGTYKRSPPYSLRVQNYDYYGRTGCYTYYPEIRLWKQFTTPDRDEIYAIFDILLRYQSAVADLWTKYVMFLFNSNMNSMIGRPFDTVKTSYVSWDKWIRVLSPLPKNLTTTVKLNLMMYNHRASNWVANEYRWLYMDDFKIISRNP